MILLGEFMTFFIITILVVVHEIGHFIMALILGVEVKEIYIYPFGGISKFNMNYNIKIFDEALILISGPIIQVVFSVLLINLSFFYNYIDLIISYNISLLIFNLLPIYPLDGGRLFNLFMNKFFSFYKAMYFTIYFGVIISSFFLLGFFYTGFINFIIIFLFCMYKLVTEYNKINFIIEKFYLERYLYNNKFNKRIIVDDMIEFKRDKSHIIFKNGVFYTEKEMLRKKYLYK